LKKVSENFTRNTLFDGNWFPPILPLFYMAKTLLAETGGNLFFATIRFAGTPAGGNPSKEKGFPPVSPSLFRPNEF